MDLLWYRGLTHAQAAEALGVATKTVQRRWASARLLIRDALHGEPPVREKDERWNRTVRRSST